MTLIAEDLLWLLHEDREGVPTVDRTALSAVLAAAVILESPEGAPVPVAPGVVAPQVLSMRSMRTAARCEGMLRRDLFTRLDRSGRVSPIRFRRFGIVPAVRRPTVDIERKDALRTALHRVLLDSHPESDRIGALIALLHAVSALPGLCRGWSADSIERSADEWLRGRARFDRMAATVRAAVCDRRAAAFACADRMR
ncbi:GPP34 family phosphoprotein [Nocardia spumae]|uniref:GPP34 family phosphoprotein n=1 Tax=Nocardia spumae TaxID=2887190 RepID=UPI001D14B3F1|nr:GPP34 family phosphoprotein [Nocardia spumae]